MSKGKYTSTTYVAKDWLCDSSSSSEECPPPQPPPVVMKRFVLLAAYILPSHPNVAILQQTSTVLGTQPVFNNALVEGSGWSITDANVTVPVTGAYQVTIDGYAELLNLVAGSFSVYATVNGSTPANILTNTLSSQVVEPSLPGNPVGSTSSSSILALTAGDVLSFWATSANVGSMLFTTSRSAVHNADDTAVLQPWYRVTLNLL